MITNVCNTSYKRAIGIIVILETLYNVLLVNNKTIDNEDQTMNDPF